MKRELVKLLLLVIIFTGSVNALKAQQTSSFLSGKVLDEKNIPVQGVSVQITYIPWNKTRDALTNKKGMYCIGNLPPGGPYIIKFSRQGYEDQTREVLSLELGTGNDMSLHMRLENKVAISEGIEGNKGAE